MDTLIGLFGKIAGTDEEHIGEDEYEREPGDIHDRLWDRWHPKLQQTIHRHLAVELPQDHPAHNASLPIEQRAQAVLDHVSGDRSRKDGWGRTRRQSLGFHWTDDPSYNHLSTGNGRLSPGETPVIVHAKTPPRHHIEDDDYTLENRAVRDWDSDPEREVPLKRNAPVTVTGVSWKSGRETLHHTFAEPIMKRATTVAERPTDAPAAPEIHRSLALVLPPDKHAFVHDQSQPEPARAHMLLSEIKKQTPDIVNEHQQGGTGGLGEFWTPHEAKAKEFTNGWSAYRNHEHEHGCGDPETGEDGCRTTHVIMHAQEPAEEHHWDEIYHPGEKYDRDVSWRLPVRPGAPMKVNGISWGEGDDHKDFTERRSGGADYQRYDFNSPVHKRAQYDHEHEWLPTGKYWAPNSAQTDQRLFDGDRLRPEVRKDVLDRLGAFFDAHGYKGWREWTKVYFAGSQAAKWLDADGKGNGDFDILIGINWPLFRDGHPEFEGKSDLQVTTAMTDGLWKTANVNGYYFTLADGRRVGPFDRTFFANPVAWDIKALHPYAAYDVTDDTWAVRPLKVPKDWSAEKLPESYWDYAEAMAHAVKAIGTLPSEEKARMARNLWEEIHTHRSDAFTGNGKGLFDLANVVEKYLDQHPDGLWDKLRAWKHGAPSSITQEAAVRNNLKDSDPSGADYQGVMIALVPPKEICADLSVEGGEAVDTMHVTLAYLGGKDEHEPEDLAMLPDLVKAWAATQKPLKAHVGGVGTFVNPTQHVLWAAVDLPHGTVFRDGLVHLLEEHGYSIRHDHGWTPHITLQYGKSHFRFLPKVKPATWDVEEIWVCLGGRWESFPIGG